MNTLIHVLACIGPVGGLLIGIVAVIVIKKGQALYHSWQLKRMLSQINTNFEHGTGEN